MARQPISKRLRYEVLRRDNHQCRYCGATPPGVHLEIDHVIPVSLGGTNAPENLVTACDACNNGKGASTPDAPLVADVASDALRWAAAMKRAAARQREDADALAVYIDSILEAWTTAFEGDVLIEHEPERRWHWGADPDRTYPWAIYIDGKITHATDTLNEADDWITQRSTRVVPPRPDDWASSAATWRAAGIDFRDLVEAAEIARDAGHIPRATRYRYFCGVIWRRIEDRQRIARDLLEVEDGDA